MYVTATLACTTKQCLVLPQGPSREVKRRLVVWASPVPRCTDSEIAVSNAPEKNNKDIHLLNHVFFPPRLEYDKGPDTRVDIARAARKKLGLELAYRVNVENTLASNELVG